MNSKYIGIVLLCIIYACTPSKTKQFEEAQQIAQSVQAELVKNSRSSIGFRQTRKQIGHYSEPWETSSYTTAGTFQLEVENGQVYFKDSVESNGKYYYSERLFEQDSLMATQYGGIELGEMTKQAAQDFLKETALFTPYFYVEAFLNAPMDEHFFYKRGDLDTISYTNSYRNKIKLLIDPVLNRVEALHITYPHELYGDATKVITYTYENGQSLPIAVQEKEHDTIMSEIELSTQVQDISSNEFKEKVPNDYRLSIAEAPKDSVTYEKFNEHIHLLNFHHTDDRILVVEFDEFMLVAEAPINTANGELIIEKVSEIAPNKPIRYFVYGHYHPHYLGGVRAFVANETTILSHALSTDYVTNIIKAARTIEPDILEKKPKEAKIEVIEQQYKIIDESGFKMEIHHIGEMSAHTIDYMVYYFPEYKLLFQDDLVWIAKEGPIKAASKRQSGLYEAIQKYELDVETIIQSWPVKEYGVQTIIDFSDLEKSIKIAEN